MAEADGNGDVGREATPNPPAPIESGGTTAPPEAQSGAPQSKETSAACVQSPPMDQVAGMANPRGGVVVRKGRGAHQMKMRSDEAAQPPPTDAARASSEAVHPVEEPRDEPSPPGRPTRPGYRHQMTFFVFPKGREVVPITLHYSGPRPTRLNNRFLHSISFTQVKKDGPGEEIVPRETVRIFHSYAELSQRLSAELVAAFEGDLAGYANVELFFNFGICLFTARKHSNPGDCAHHLLPMLDDLSDKSAQTHFMSDVPGAIRSVVPLLFDDDTAVETSIKATFSLYSKSTASFVLLCATLNLLPGGALQVGSVATESVGIWHNWTLIPFPEAELEPGELDLAFPLQVSIHGFTQKGSHPAAAFVENLLCVLLPTVRFDPSGGFDLDVVPLGVLEDNLFAVTRLTLEESKTRRLFSLRVTEKNSTTYAFFLREHGIVEDFCVELLPHNIFKQREVRIHWPMESFRTPAANLEPVGDAIALISKMVTAANAFRRRPKPRDSAASQPSQGRTSVPQEDPRPRYSGGSKPSRFSGRWRTQQEVPLPRHSGRSKASERRARKVRSCTGIPAMDEAKEVPEEDLWDMPNSTGGGTMSTNFVRTQGDM